MLENSREKVQVWGRNGGPPYSENGLGKMGVYGPKMPGVFEAEIQGEIGRFGGLVEPAKMT